MENKFLIDSKIHSIILQLFSEKTALPVLIYERSDRIKGLFDSKEFFSPFCKIAITDSILGPRCEEDHKSGLSK